MTDVPRSGSRHSWTRRSNELRLGQTDEKSQSRDLSGLNCRIFDPFWYWEGCGVPTLEAIVDSAYYFVGQLTTHSTPERIALPLHQVEAETSRCVAEMRLPGGEIGRM
jgi:hypothetical protein